MQCDVVKGQPVRAGVGEADMIKIDPSCQPVGYLDILVDCKRRGVILQPGQPASAVQPDPAEEADLTDGRTDVGRQLRSRGQNQQHGSDRCT